MGQGGCSTGLACVLIIINKVLLAVGILLVIFGAIAYFAASIIVDSIDVYDYINNKLGGTESALNGLSLEDLLEPFGIAMMAFGCFLIILCVIGLCGAQKKSKPLLIIYATIVLIIVAVQIAIIVAFYGFNDTLSGLVKTAWNETIIKYYAGDNDTSTEYGSVSLFWTATHRYLKCCGVDNYWDFHGAENWNRTGLGLTAPVSCCIYNTIFPKDGTPICGAATCSNSPNATCNYLTTGCYSAVEELVKTPSQVMMYIVIGSIAVEITLAIIAIYICVKETDDKSSN